MPLDHIRLHTLTTEELAGVVHLYPWFGGARRELCLRMARSGGEGWGQEQYADAALYLGSRSIVSDIVRSSTAHDWSDKDVDALLKSFLQADTQEQTPSERPVRVVGGDYFTQAQYDGVRRTEDNVFSHYAARATSENSQEEETFTDAQFCTETLAQIYVEQGYYEPARKIYSRLSLRYPEKSAYFASLIEKLN